MLYRQAQRSYRQAQRSYRIGRSDRQASHLWLDRIGIGSLEKILIGSALIIMFDFFFGIGLS